MTRCLIPHAPSMSILTFISIIPGIALDSLTNGSRSLQGGGTESRVRLGVLIPDDPYMVCVPGAVILHASNRPDSSRRPPDDSSRPSPTPTQPRKGWSSSSHPSDRGLPPTVGSGRAKKRANPSNSEIGLKRGPSSITPRNQSYPGPRSLASQSQMGRTSSPILVSRGEVHIFR